MPNSAMCGTAIPGTEILDVAERFAGNLSQCLEDVLSAMFFSGVSREISGGFDPDAPFFNAVVSFSGSINGEMGLAVPMDIAGTLATDFYGSDESMEDRAVEYAVCELANMVCGSTLSRSAPKAYVTLTHPRLAEEPFLAGSEVRMFELVDGAVAVSYRFDPE